MVKFERFIDKFIGFFVVLLLSSFKFLDKKIKKPKRILIIKLWAIGDSVISLTLIKAIKKKFPNAKIDVLTRKKIIDVFYTCESINKIINYDENWKKIMFSGRKYDLVFDTEPYLNLSSILAFILGSFRIGFSNQWRSKLYNKTIKFNKKQHMVQNYLDMLRSLGIQYNTDELEKLYVDDISKKNVKNYLQKNKLSKKDIIIGITPGVAESAKSRMWFEDRFANLCDILQEKLNVKILFIDGPSNQNIIKKIISLMKINKNVYVPSFKLSETFYLISKCNIFISNDTGPMHIAAAQGCKTIGLFGPNTPVLWGPYGKDNIAIYKTKLPPSIQNDKAIFPDRNREEYMGPISVDDVFNAVKSLLTK